MDFRGGQDADPIAAVEFLSKYCQWAVVTLGSNGCLAKHGKEVCKFFAVILFFAKHVKRVGWEVEEGCIRNLSAFCLIFH